MTNIFRGGGWGGGGGDIACSGGNELQSNGYITHYDQPLWSHSDHLRESGSHLTELGSCESSSIGSLISKTNYKSLPKVKLNLRDLLIMLRDLVIISLDLNIFNYYEIARDYYEIS